MMRSLTTSSERDTIFALATAAGRAGIAVVRVSGPEADAVLRHLTRRELPEPRRAELRDIVDKTNDSVIDRCLVIRFPSGRSYTGENVVEFHIHGGKAVISAVLNALSRQDLRAAEPGEFTRRAVESGRLDLTQAEAIADLVEAETEGQRRQALSQLEGKLSELYENWRARLIRAAAWFEAAIDFPDEDIPEMAMDQSNEMVRTILAEMQVHLNDGRGGEILRDGLHVAVMGPPNVGKSSLVNALARRDVAIVSSIAGTTRDIIEVRLDLKGYPVILSDTAGLREARDTIETEGIRRALERAEEADFRLLVLDSAAKIGLKEINNAFSKANAVIYNKADLVTSRERPGLWVSATTGEGLDALIDCLAEAAQANQYSNDKPRLTRVRHRQAVEHAVQALQAALSLSEMELKAESLRLALNAIGRITGRVDLDELLDVVFRDFCIGK